jgi:hypothetical protein
MGARTKSKFRKAHFGKLRGAFGRGNMHRGLQWRRILVSVHYLECLNEIHTLRTVTTLSVALKGSTRLDLIPDYRLVLIRYAAIFHPLLA